MIHTDTCMSAQSNTISRSIAAGRTRSTKPPDRRRPIRTCPAAPSRGTPVASSPASTATAAPTTALLYTSPNWSNHVRSCGRLACG